jgi:hypothetical protein
VPSVDRQFAVVCWSSGPLTPRGERARHVIRALGDHGYVRRVGPGDNAAGVRASPSDTRRTMRARVGQMLVRHILLDKSELHVARTMLTWRPKCDAAVLIGFPFAPLAYAADRLTRHGIPYVVDIGDPWTLPTRGRDAVPRASARAQHAERRMWSNASGGIVTTPGQAQAIGSAFPKIPLLVRPNGFETVAAPRNPRSQRDSSVLRLVHYGNFYEARLDPIDFFANLAASGRWRRITLRQHGSDWSGQLDQVARFVDVDPQAPIPWQQAVHESPQFDAALVIGNRNPDQLPSKAIQYLTLPIPRVALISSPADALGTYVRTRPGWLAARANDDALATQLHAFCNRRWTRGDLEPPLSESWPRVAEQIARFILTATGFSSRAGAAAAETT